MTLPRLLWLELVAVEVAAVGLAGRARVGRPLVLLLAFALADELAVEALHVLVFEGAPRPFAGWVRAAYHVESAIVTAWPALLAATCWRCFGPSRPPISTPAKSSANLIGDLSNSRQIRWSSSGFDSSALDVLFAAWVGLVVGLAALYPLDPPGSGAPRTRAVLHTWEVLCVAVAWWGVWRGRARRWGRVEEALVIVAACETMVALVGPFASDPFTRWWIARCFYLAAWGGVGVVLSRPNARGRE